MKNLVILAVLAPALCLNGYGKTYTVDSTDATSISTDPLKSGTTYLFQASGSYQYDKVNRANKWADAEFIDYAASGVEYGILEKRGLGVNEDILDLVIDGQEVDWLGNNGSGWAPHTYSPNHVYRYYVDGNDAPASLIIADWAPLVSEDHTGDNSGSLRVSISPVPDGGSSLLLLGFTLLLINALRCRDRKQFIE